MKDPVPINPCRPSPCGPYSECREVNTHAVCSCQQNYIGSPPACRAECVVSSECIQDKACINQKCIDPCPGTCGLNARCSTINHNPICSCSPGFTGDPFIRCLPEESKLASILSLPSLLLFYYIPIYTPCRTPGTKRTGKSVHTQPLWPQLAMSCGWCCTCMLLSAKLYRSSSKLSSGVYNKFRVRWKSCMYKREMSGSMPRLMWTERYLQCN